MLDPEWLVVPLSDRDLRSRRGESTIGRGTITKQGGSLLSTPKQCLSLLVAPIDHGCMSVTLTGCLISRLLSCLDEMALPFPPVWLLSFGERSGRKPVVPVSCITL